MSQVKNQAEKRRWQEIVQRVRKNSSNKKGAGIAIVDVENNNPAGICFVQGLGFKQAESYIWFSKNIEK